MTDELKQEMTETFDKITPSEFTNPTMYDSLLKVYLAGGEHGYQYAVDMIANHLLCIELSNFFPTLDEDEEIAKGRKKLIQYIRKAMEE